MCVCPRGCVYVSVCVCVCVSLCVIVCVCVCVTWPKQEELTMEIHCSHLDSNTQAFSTQHKPGICKRSSAEARCLFRRESRIGVRIWQYPVGLTSNNTRAVSDEANTNTLLFNNSNLAGFGVLLALYGGKPTMTYYILYPGSAPTQIRHKYRSLDLYPASS